MKRTLWFVVLALALMPALVFASGDREQEGGGTESAEPTAEGPAPTQWSTGGIDLPIVEEPMTIDIVVSSNPSWPLDNLNSGVGFTAIEERTNVHLNVQEISSAAYPERLGIMLNTGEIPDILYDFGPDQILQAKELFLNVQEVLDENPGLMPNFERVREIFPDVDLHKPSPDELYFLPHTFGSRLYLESVYNIVYHFREDINEELGLTVPETYDEFTEYLRALKEAYPDAAPFTSRQSMPWFIMGIAPSWGLNMAPGAYGASWLEYDPDTRRWSSPFENPNFKAMISYFHDLYEEGLIDQQFALVWNNTSLWEEKMVTSRALTTIDWYNRSFSVTATGRQGGDEDFALAAYYPPVADVPGAVSDYYVWGQGAQLMAISANVENPEALLRYIDYVYYSEEGVMFNHVGVEGETYTMTGDRTYTPIDPGDSEQAWRAERGVGIPRFIGPNPFSLGIVMDPNPYLDDPFRDSVDARFRAEDKGLPLAPTVAYSDDELQEKADLDVAVNEVFEASLIQFIIGQRPMSEWEDFAAEVNERGLPRLVDLANAAMARMDGE